MKYLTRSVILLRIGFTSKNNCKNTCKQTYMVVHIVCSEINCKSAVLVALPA